MNNEENTQGNPKAVDDGVFGSDSDDFFSALDESVNNLVQEPEKPETQTEVTSDNQSSNKTVNTEAAVSQSSESSELESLKKRYSDSSREAQNLKAQLNELKPFVPVLDAMKKDNGLVNHVRDYFQEGGKVNKNIKEQLKLDDDFEFDPDEMVTNPDSDSRKVFDNMVSNIVNKKANEIVSQQNQQAEKIRHQDSVKKQAAEFMEKHGMTQDEFQAFATEAQARISERGITFDDMYAMVNQNKVNANVANATKKDMINQMKNVRDIPTSVGSANNAGKVNDINDRAFDALLNSDGNIEELLG
jgi:antitoxin component of RelBE/YafQ-DinJ toxin-antitoxin module